MTNQEFIESIRLEGEEWRDAVGMEGFYIVSSEGRFASLGRFVLSKNGSYRYKQPRLQTQTKSHTGYMMIRTSILGKRKTRAVHPIVGKTFIPNPNNYPTIDHIDRDKTNNKVSNLRWCTLSENMKNPLTVAYIKSLKIGKDRPEIYRGVVAIKDGELFKKYDSFKSASLDGYSSRNIYKACTGRSRSYRGFRWMYLSDYENLVSMSKNFSEPGND